MKIKQLLLLVLLLGVINVDVSAQDRQKISLFNLKSNKSNAVENVDSLMFIIDSLRGQLSLRDSIAESQQRLIATMRDESVRMALSVSCERDSLLSVIRSRDEKIATLRSNVGFVDTCMVRLANRWLFERFDRVAVKDAISYFDRIYATSFRDEYSIVQELLANYESAYGEFQAILKQAQADCDRENPFATDSFKNKYVKMIVNMPYYKRYYESDWNIVYLNGQISKALDLLRNHSSRRLADFSQLIDPNL